RREGRNGGHIREEPAPKESVRTDTGRSDESGSRHEDDRATSSEDPDSDGRRVPRHVRGRSSGADPDRPSRRWIAIRIRSRRLPGSIPHVLRDGHHRRRRLSRRLQIFPDKYLYTERFHSATVRRDLAMAAKKAKGDDWFSSLDAELEKKTKEIIEDEGEHYYKYSGWKRIWTIHTLYEQPLDRANVDDLHRLFADLVRTWYESHLRRNRDVLIKYLKQTFEKIETFNQ